VQVFQFFTPEAFMSIEDTHWTDEDIAAFAKPYLNKTSQTAGYENSPAVVCSSIFLSPNSLGCAPDKMASGIQAKLIETLPNAVLEGLSLEKLTQAFMKLYFLMYLKDNAFHIVLSRPDPNSTLKERLAERAGIAPHNVVLSKEGATASSFDNLELMKRILFAVNAFNNGGEERLLQAGVFGHMEYRCMQGAKHEFKRLGGNVQTIRLYESASYIAAFTKNMIPYQSLGFLNAFGFNSDQIVGELYSKIKQDLQEFGETRAANDKQSAELVVKEQPDFPQEMLTDLQGLVDEYKELAKNQPLGPDFLKDRLVPDIQQFYDHYTSYVQAPPQNIPTTPIRNLHPNLSALLDQHQSCIDVTQQTILPAFINAGTSDAPFTEGEHQVLTRLTQKEIIQTTIGFVLHQTLNGLELLTTQNQTPLKPSTAFQQINQAAKLRYLHYPIIPTI
jgi:hypothetical protein